MSWRRTFVSEKPWSIDQLRVSHQRVALDANLLIYLIEASDEHGPAARAVVDAIESGAIAGSLATVGQLEVLTGPARVGDAAMFEQTADEVRSLGLQLTDLSAEVAEDAAWIRGTAGLELADAIHVASARAAGATAFVTNDHRIRSRIGLEVLYLDDMELASDDQAG
jgi:predicted nucleic acid-binding protein